MTQKCQKRRKIGDDEELAHLSERTEAEKFQVSFIDTYIGNGVFAKQNIRAVDLLMEYSGKLLHGAPDQDTSYVYYFPRGCNTCIDATDNACMARMVNDIDNATKANCKMKKVAVHGDPCLALYALKDIEKGAELRYDYGDGKAPWRKGKNKGGDVENTVPVVRLGGKKHYGSNVVASTGNHVQPKDNKGKTAKPVNEKTRREAQKRTEDQIKLLKTLFKTNIQLRRELRRTDCEKVLNKYSVLGNLVWKKVKNTIHNWISQEKRKMKQLNVMG